eukprot:5814373-Pleurochrysis_carterae.AAC.1
MFGMYRGPTSRPRYIAMLIPRPRRSAILPLSAAGRVRRRARRARRRLRARRAVGRGLLHGAGTHARADSVEPDAQISSR